MSNTRPEKQAPGWPLWKISAVLYPFAAGAAAVNIFFLGLILHATGLPALSPVLSVGLGLILGFPLAWIAGKWVQRLIREAEDQG